MDLEKIVQVVKLWLTIVLRGYKERIRTFGELRLKFNKMGAVHQPPPSMQDISQVFAVLRVHGDNQHRQRQVLIFWHGDSKAACHDL